MRPGELRQLLQNEIDLFYEEGQKDPMPVLARLKEAAAAELTFPARLPSPPEPEAPAGWLLVYQEGRPDLQAMSLPAMIRQVRELPACPGILLFPGERPVYLTRDLFPLICGSETGGRAAGRDSVRRLLEQGDAYRDPEGSYDDDASLACYRQAYEAARADRESPEYVEACLRLAGYHGDLLEEDELSELLDQAIAYAGLLINAGCPEGPDLLIRARRLQEQAAERAARRMRYARALPPSFFEF